MNAPEWPLIVYGASDGGALVVLNLEYDPDGTGEWRIGVVNGGAFVTIIPARGEDEGDDGDGCPGYSDKAIVATSGNDVSVRMEVGD